MNPTLELPLTLRYCDGMRFNLAPESRSFDCKFIEPGIVSYRNVGGKIELLRKETLDRCMVSVIGNPLTIGHVDLDDDREEVQNGVVQKWRYNAEDAWYYVSGDVDTEAAKSEIQLNGKPSCGYRVKALGPGGVYHGIRYDQEILDLEFNHLAIVKRPRYEEANFRLNSVTSETQSIMNIVKFFKKLVTRENGADGKTVDVEKTITHETSDQTEVEIDGKMVRLNELFDTYLKETAAAFTITPETALEVSGQTVTMGQLADAFRKNAVRNNSAETPEQKAVREKKESDDKVAALQRDNELAEKKKKDDTARENGNSAFFQLHAARSTPKIDGGFSTSSGSLKEKCDRGAKRY